MISAPANRVFPKQKHELELEQRSDLLSKKELKRVIFEII
jgi:hypothetical protein